MIGMRRKGRMAALQILYLNDLCKLSIHQIHRKVLSEKTLDEATQTFAKQLAEGVLSHQEEIDSYLVELAKNWELKRMATADRCILRLGAYELLYEQGTPVSVVINEAVELAKLYATEDSGKFVNGLLDQIKKKRKLPFEKK